MIFSFPYQLLNFIWYFIKSKEKNCMGATINFAKPTTINQLIDHLFRHEAGKLIAVLTRIFGSENIDLAEDVVQEALIEALKQWSYKGVPEKPSAWLFKVAKNKALNIINREKYEREYKSDIVHYLQSASTIEPALNHIFSEQEILDDQLRMMFICCHPALSIDSQIALTLKTLCGFSIQEIARGFLSTEENINKRLVRARQKIRDDQIPFEMPPAAQLEVRSDAVLQIIYLLFNEGYSASTGNDLIRYELCQEAIRLAEIMVSHPIIQEKSNVFALLALMLFNASRFHSRQDESGNIMPMSLQDRSKWDRELIQKGFHYIGKGNPPKKISTYHILAAISAHHCSATDFASTNWQGILSLYDSLLQLDRSPIVLLNRSVALSKVKGPSAALEELEKIKSDPFLESYYLFYATQAELYMELNQVPEAINNFKKAIHLAPLKAEKDLLQKKLNSCSEKFI